MAGRSLSLAQARRAALAAQGFATPRPERVTAGHVRRLVKRLGLLQLDFVNVLVPAHHLIAFSRLGGYAPETFRHALYGDGQFTEQWAHEASLVPISHWRLLEHRRKAFKPWPNSPIMRLKGRKKYLSEVIETIQKDGPLTSRDLPPVAGPSRRAGDWHRSVPRSALEYHFGAGELAVRERLSNFQRVYDLAERVIEPEHFECSLSADEQRFELIRIAAHACGIGTVHDLADYFRMTCREAMPHIRELIARGELAEVQVEGWSTTAWLSRRLSIPRKLDASSLLSPFDPVVWFRPRAERLFDFHYRIEIYVPAARRKWGYYVLPYLQGDDIVARVDLKADRRNSALLVLATHPEPGIEPTRVAAGLAAELRALADWLCLEDIKVGRRGKLARALAGAVRG